MAKKTRYKGVYLNESKQKYYYATRIKCEDGTYKSIKSKSIYVNPLLCYSALQQCKSTKMVESPDNTSNVIKSNNIVKKRKMIVNETSLSYVCESFLDAYKLKNRESSYYSVNNIINTYLYKYFGESIPFKQLCHNDVLTKFKLYISNFSICVSRKNKILSILKLLAERAFYMNIINQVDLGMFKLNLDSFKQTNQKISNEKKFYTLEEFKKFTSVIEEEQWKVAFEILFYGGFRISEFLAITVNDIDRESYTIRINNQLGKNKQFVDVKNKNGNRITLINKEAFARLLKYIDKQNLKDNDFVFPFSRTTITRKNNEFQKKANLEHIKIHGFRHSCCSYLFQVYINNNLTPNFKFIASQLGDSVAIVQSTYAHMYQSEQSKMLDLL